MALRDIKAEVELGYDLELALKEAERCLNCDVQTVFTGQLCIECDACVDICPMDCITFTAERRGSRSALAPAGAGEQPHPGPLHRQQPQDRPRHGQGRGRLPALRAVRRTLPHRRVGHAEIPHRYDSRGTSMPIESVNDFVVRFANVNGSGSASANELFARSVLRMGIPVAPRNIFPSNIQGLPTWYEVRISEAGHLGARGGTDLMVAMNPQTWDQDVAGIEPGGYLLYNSTKPLPKSKFRDDITVIGVPLTAICNREYTDPRQRQLFKNIIYVGALSALLDMDDPRNREAHRRAVQGQGEAVRRQQARAASRPRLGDDEPRLPDRPAAEARQRRRRPHLHRGQFGRRARRRLWRRDGLRLVSDHAVLLARRGVHQPLQPPARRSTRPRRTNSPSSRPRTNWPRSASSSAPPGTAPAPSPRPPGREFR